MLTEEDDCGWEEMYESCGVRCDIEIASSLCVRACPAPIAPPETPDEEESPERWSSGNVIPLDAYA